MIKKNTYSFYHKRIRTALCAVLCSVLTAMPAFATGEDNSPTAAASTTVWTKASEIMQDGVTVVVTLSETNGIARSSRTHSVTKEYYKDGAYIGAATLYASFYYDGSSSSATAASGAGAGSNGWSYSGQSVWTSGNSAYLNATLSRNGTFIPVSLSLCCDAYGNVS